MPTSTPFRLLALGDSYTIGTSVASVDSWPYQLTDQLVSQGIPANPPQIIAQNGWTTHDLAAGIIETDLEDSYDLVTLLIGVNNQFRGDSIDEYRTEFDHLLGQAIRFAGGDPTNVIVLSIPDWGVTPFASSRDSARIASQIDAFNAVNRTEATAAGVFYVDITAISRQMESDPTLVASDGLHPSPKMYSRWVEAILPAVHEAMGR